MEWIEGDRKDSEGYIGIGEDCRECLQMGFLLASVATGQIWSPVCPTKH